MATDLQRKALEKTVEMGRTKKRLIKGQILTAVGYSKNTAIAPDKVFKSKGFLELAEELGLTDELLTSALVEDIKNKKGNRKPELELGFKVKGHLKDKEEPPNIYNTIIFTDEQSAEIARRRLAGNTSSPAESN